MTLVVFGATGQLGAHVIDSLLARGVAPEQILAAGRSAERLSSLAQRGLRTTQVDFGDPHTLDGVLEAGQQVLLISSSEVGQRAQQHGAVIDAAGKAGVARIVYTSAPRATTSDLVLAPEHKATEELLSASGLPFTILRNGWYTENYRPDVDRARETGVIATSAGQGRVASAPRADYAEAAAVALTTEGHLGAVYELSGDEAWSFGELAATASRVLGRDVTYQALTPQQETEALLAAGLDEATAGFVVALNGNVRDGLLAETTGELSRLLGRPTETLEETLRGWYDER